MSQPNVFPDAHFPYEYWSLEYWPISVGGIPVVTDICGCITIEDMNYFDVFIMDEAI